jgi:hypothetical protein
MKKNSSQFNDFLQQIQPGASKYLLPAGIAAAAAGLGAGALTARGDARPEEDSEERRNRILRNAMMGTAAGGTAAGLGTFGYNQLNTPLEPGDPGALTSLTRHPAAVGGLGAAGYGILGFAPGFDVKDLARRELLAMADKLPEDDKATRTAVRNVFNALRGDPQKFIGDINRLHPDGPPAKLQYLLRSTGLGGYSNAKVLPSWASRLGMREGVKVPAFLQGMKALRLGSGPAKTRLGLAAAIGLAPALASAIF